MSLELIVLKMNDNVQACNGLTIFDIHSFYNHFKNDPVVQTNYLKKYPEKFFKNQNPIWIIKEHFRENPNQKFCIGVQWHPEFLIDDKDLEIFKALVESSRKN